MKVQCWGPMWSEKVGWWWCCCLVSSRSGWLQELLTELKRIWKFLMAFAIKRQKMISALFQNYFGYSSLSINYGSFCVLCMRLTFSSHCLSLQRVMYKGLSDVGKSWCDWQQERYMWVLCLQDFFFVSKSWPNGPHWHLWLGIDMAMSSKTKFPVIHCLQFLFRPQ